MSPKTRPKDLIIPFTGDSLFGITPPLRAKEEKQKNRRQGSGLGLCPLPFQMPTRLAAGLGLGSALSIEDYAPYSGSPVSILRMDFGYNSIIFIIGLCKYVVK
jgi:hypothetical protein